MSKKLNIIEAMKMPIGTEFEVHYDDGFNFDDGNRLKLEKCLDGSKLVWLNGEDVCCGNQFITATFIPIQQPVSFMEVVDSKEDCRVEHPLLDIIIATKEDNAYNYEFNNKGYLPLNCLFHILGGHLGVREVKKVINEGKWYIEESEELEDERLS